eukprot:58641_1
MLGKHKRATDDETEDTERKTPSIGTSTSTSTSNRRRICHEQSNIDYQEYITTLLTVGNSKLRDNQKFMSRFVQDTTNLKVVYPPKFLMCGRKLNAKSTPTDIYNKYKAFKAFNIFVTSWFTGEFVDENVTLPVWHYRTPSMSDIEDVVEHVHTAKLCVGPCWYDKCDDTRFAILQEVNRVFNQLSNSADKCKLLSFFLNGAIPTAKIRKRTGKCHYHIYSKALRSVLPETQWTLESLWRPDMNQCRNSCCIPNEQYQIEYKERGGMRYGITRGAQFG